ncbi:MAG: hypothetical protein ACRYF3_02360, partial [Janthinobacterium lividum]
MVTSVRRVPLWLAYLLSGAVALLVCLCLSGTAHSVVFISVSLATPVAVAVGVYRYRPQRPSAWWLMVAGLGAWAGGDVASGFAGDLVGSQAYPRVCDIFYALAYPLLAAALLRLARQARPGRDVEGVIDAAIFAVGLGLLSWTFLIAPVLSGFHTDPLAGSVALVYPVGDLVVLAMLVRVFAASGHRSPAFRLLASAVILLLVADAAYQYAVTYEGYVGAGVDPIWLTAYVLWGTAAL